MNDVLIAIMECNINILLSSCLVAIAGILWSYYYPTTINYESWRIHNRDDIIHALSAAIGSAVSITLLYPLETIRTRAQVDVSDGSRESLVHTIISIFRKEGLARGLYKGWFSLVVALWSLNFVYFYFFHSLRRWVENLDTSSFNNQTVIDLLVGYGAGVIAVLFTGPLWLGKLCCVVFVYLMHLISYVLSFILIYHIVYQLIQG